MNDKYNQNYDSTIGIIEDVKFLMKINTKFGERNKYAVTINGEPYEALGDWILDHRGEEGEWNWKLNSWTNKMGVEKTSKVLSEPRARVPKSGVAPKPPREFEELLTKVTRIEKGIEEIYKLLKK